MQVNTDATQIQVQGNLHQALKKDQRQFLLYLDSLLLDAESRIDTMPGFTQTYPVADSDEHKGLSTPRSVNNAGHHKVLSVKITAKDGEALSGNVNADTPLLQDNRGNSISQHFGQTANLDEQTAMQPLMFDHGVHFQQDLELHSPSGSQEGSRSPAMDADREVFTPSTGKQY